MTVWWTATVKDKGTRIHSPTPELTTIVSEERITIKDADTHISK